MPRARLIALVAIHVDTPDETAALAAVQAFGNEAGLAFGRLRWAPYPKLGPQSRVSFYWRLPADVRAETKVVAALDGFCAAIVGKSEGGTRLFHRHDEITPGAPGFHDERIFDARSTPFSVSAFGWFDVEINTYPAAQKDLRRWVRQEESPPDELSWPGQARP